MGYVRLQSIDYYYLPDKVVVNQPYPYLSHKNYKAKYEKYKGYYGHEPLIRYNNNSRNYIVKNHPNYKNSKYYVREGDDDKRGYNNYERDDHRNTSYKNYKSKGKKGIKH